MICINIVAMFPLIVKEIRVYLYLIKKPTEYDSVGFNR